MLRKSRNPSEEDEEVTRRGKLGEFSNKVERMFRAAFKKDSNVPSQSKQSQKSIDSDIEEASNLKSVLSPTRKTSKSVERSQAVDSSDISDFDTGSRTNLVRIDKISKLSDEKIVKEEEKSKSTTRRLRKLKRSEHVHSNELESNSMDVVADIHCENPNKNAKDNLNRVEEDTIESLSEPELNKTPLKGDLKMHEESAFDNSVDSVRKQRKRWSKEASVIKLPSRTSFSSTSARSSPWRSLQDEDTVVPVPAARINKIISLQGEDSDAGLDNAAFESDNNDHQVLRIETSYGVAEETKIEMTSVENITDSLDSSPQIVKSEIEEFGKFTKTHRKLSVQSKDSKIGETIHQLPKRVKSFVSENPSVDHSEDSLSSKIHKKKAKSKTRMRHERRDNSSSRSYDSGEYNQTGDSELSSPDVPALRKPRRRAKRQTAGEEVSSEGTERSPKIEKVKQKRRSLSTSRDSEDTVLSNNKQSSKKSKKPRKKPERREVKFISVRIHKADMLEADYVTRHPMVIVHIVKANTGDYLKLEGPEISGGHFLQPLITGTFDFKENKSMVPYWDEELIFELDSETLLGTEKDQVLILFEVVDLLSFAEASQSYEQFGAENCWYKIAWAFLKPVGRDGRCHLDKQVRLQLYKPKRLMRKSIRHKCEAFSWWKSGARDKYSSSLYTTITSVPPPKLEPVFYGHIPVNDLPSPPFPQKSANTPEPIYLPKWSRLAAQSCKIPNDLYFQTEVAENGSFHALFSTTGMYLASVVSEEYDYPIIIHKVDELKVFIKFTGHKSFVYSLDWSPNDDYLLSVSSDQTARVWDVKNRLINHIFMLPHPSYIYSGKFHPSLHLQTIVTGCYDHVVRVWGTSSSSYELLQELEGHEGFINSICFQKNGTMLTADSVGVIIHWSVRKSRKKVNKDWSIFRKIKIREVEGVPINTIVLHPLGSRLLVHSRNNGLRMLDLATGVVLHKYEGLKNLRIQITARISPCGGLLLCGGEDGVLNIWSVESGKKVAVYHTQPKNLPVTSVDYHPYDHVLVYTTFGAPSGAVVLRFDKTASGDGVCLKMLNEEGELSVTSGSVNGNKLNSGRRFSGETLRSQKNFPMRAEGVGNVRRSSNGSREDLRKRLKIFNETEGELKTRSANRLTNIIAKIDRILSNSSKSNYDVEANRLEVPVEDVPMRTIPYVPPLFSTFDDHSSESKSTDVFEMMSFDRKNYEKCRSKSARVETTFKASEEEVGRALSDGIVNSRGRTREPWRTENREINKERWQEDRRESSGGSGGTYVVDIDENQEEMRGESENSVRSDATFVVENERIKPPVPKPRRKSGLTHDIR
ncbi:jouberin-like [Diachasmimorpha longicaudata]|uniref:jouberin-like n=1 Tax=Diachasmimorpha longicaudata TaxID=58733 RepID=UPI0030B88A25